jgi:hypothetical protein
VIEMADAAAQVAVRVQRDERRARLREHALERRRGRAGARGIRGDRLARKTQKKLAIRFGRHSLFKCNHEDTKKNSCRRGCVLSCRCRRAKHAERGRKITDDRGFVAGHVTGIGILQDDRVARAEQTRGAHYGDRRPAAARVIRA